VCMLLIRVFSFSWEKRMSKRIMIYKFHINTNIIDLLKMKSLRARNQSCYKDYLKIFWWLLYMYSRWHKTSHFSHLLVFWPLLAWNIWFEAPSLLPAKWQCQNSPSKGNFIEKCLISEHCIILSLEEKQDRTFFKVKLYTEE